MESDKKASDGTTRLIHDLRGPVINIEAFAHELMESIHAFRSYMDSQSELVEEGIKAEINEAVSNDFEFCSKSILTAAKLLQERLDQFSKEST